MAFGYAQSVRWSAAYSTSLAQAPMDTHVSASFSKHSQKVTASLGPWLRSMTKLARVRTQALPDRSLPSITLVFDVPIPWLSASRINHTRHSPKSPLVKRASPRKAMESRSSNKIVPRTAIARLAAHPREAEGPPRWSVAVASPESSIAVKVDSPSRRGGPPSLLTRLPKANYARTQGSPFMTKSLHSTSKYRHS